MNDPRIGDVVHYVPQLAGPAPQCLAALAIDTPTSGTEINAAVWTRIGDTYTAYPAYDSDGAITDEDGDTSSSFGGFTPGTWHHIH